MRPRHHDRLTVASVALAFAALFANPLNAGVTINPGGSVTLTPTSTLPPGINITNNGSLTVNTNFTAGLISGLGSLTVGANWTLTLNNNTGAAKEGSLTLNTGAQLNITNNQLVIEAPDTSTKASDLSQLTAAVASGKNGGLWNGPGIVSSALSGDLSIAVVDNPALATPFTVFGGQNVDANSILVAPELLGDANIDGHVNLTDLNIVLNNLGANSSAWTSGNFDGAPTIDLTDLNFVLNNLGATYANSGSIIAGEPLLPSITAQTPEPSSFAALAILMPVLFSRFTIGKRRSRYRASA